MLKPSIYVTTCVLLLVAGPCLCQQEQHTINPPVHVSPHIVQPPPPVRHLRDDTPLQHTTTDQLHASPNAAHKLLHTAPRLPVGTVTLLTIVMAAASGLGALPFFFVSNLSKLWTGLANAIACGFMLAASFDLLHEGEPYGPILVVLGVVMGAVFIAHSHAFLEQYEDAEFESLKGAGARKTLLIIGVMAAHAFGEGCGVGVSFCGSRGWKQGLLVTIAIGVHNIPEGLAKATVLVAQGVSARRALWWSVLTCLPQPLVAVPSFLFVDTFRALLPMALGFACGCMVWIVASELLPDALEDAPPRAVATAVTLSAATLEAVRMGLNTLQQADGSLRWPVHAPASVLVSMVVLGVLAVAIAIAAGGCIASLPLQHPDLLSILTGLLIGSSCIDTLATLIHGHISRPMSLLLLGVGGAMCISAWRHRAHGMAALLGISNAAWMHGDGVSQLPTWHKGSPPRVEGEKRGEGEGVVGHKGGAHEHPLHARCGCGCDKVGDSLLSPPSIAYTYTHMHPTHSMAVQRHVHPSTHPPLMAHHGAPIPPTPTHPCTNGNGVTHQHTNTQHNGIPHTTNHHITTTPLDVMLPAHHTLHHHHHHHHPQLRSPIGTAAILVITLLTAAAVADGAWLAGIITAPTSVPKSMLKHTWAMLWRALAVAAATGLVLEPKYKPTTKIMAMGGAAGLAHAITLLVAMLGVCCCDWQVDGVGDRLRWGAAAGRVLVTGGLLAMGGGVLQPMEGAHGKQQMGGGWWGGVACGVGLRVMQAIMAG